MPLGKHRHVCAQDPPGLAPITISLPSVPPLSFPLNQEQGLSVPGMEQAPPCPRAFAHAISTPGILFLDLVSSLVLHLQVSAQSSTPPLHPPPSAGAWII